MNIYLLVEGRNTERVLYTSWLTACLDGYSLTDDFERPSGKSIYCFSGNGFPSILGRALPAAVADVRAVGRYEVLMVVFDSDDADVGELRARVAQIVAEAGGLPPRTELVVIVQKRCIESWLLGNRNFVPRFAQSVELVECKRFYDVSANCPEEMGCPESYGGSASAFHSRYLKAAFVERGCVYSKSRPGEAASIEYFRYLRARNQDGHLREMSSLFDFIEEYGNI